MGKKVDLAGQKIGQLLVLRKGDRDRHGRFKWWCKCVCGNEKQVHGRHLVNDAVKTCGCRTGIDLPKPFLGKTGSQHPKWKGGAYITRDGYRMVYVAPGTYEMEHRIAVKDLLFDGSVVHHKNHDKTDNRRENLAVMTRAEHAREHALGIVVGGFRTSPSGVGPRS